MELKRLKELSDTVEDISNSIKYVNKEIEKSLEINKPIDKNLLTIRDVLVATLNNIYRREKFDLKK